MRNRWSDDEAGKMITDYAATGVNEDIALRVYTSRLLGNDAKLVLHGGGNTSVKTVLPDIMGTDTDVLCVKGSGWDMGNIEPAGLPAVRLEPLRKMVSLSSLSDEDMVNVQRINLLDSTSPNPSVETLLHAFLPHKFVDHTHSNAVLAISDQVGGDELCREIYGTRMGYVPYIMPGFDLAKKAFEVYNDNPDVEGLILFKHGIFTFADTAKQAYDRMIEMVELAEQRISQNGAKSFTSVSLPEDIASVADVAPILRGLVSKSETGSPVRMLMEFRISPEILNYVNGSEISRYGCQGTVTPDHVIRTKSNPLIVAAPAAGKLDDFKQQATEAVDRYIEDYHTYFARHNASYEIPKTELDPLPRIIMVPGLGLFGLGNSPKAAAIAADLAETNIEVISHAEAMAPYQVIPEADIFDIEYWSLEQAKLGKGGEKSLQRKVAIVTGGGSGIGAATAKALADEGAAIAVVDLNVDQAGAVAKSIGGIAIGCDVTKPDQVRATFDQVCQTFGGVDIVVSNAGMAWQGRIGDVDDETLRSSFELNFFAHHSVAQNAVRVMKAQGTGGCLLFNTSKQALNPGKDFGPYGLPKAATLFLMKQYALDHGADGIRSNAVNADRIRSGLLTDDMIAARSSARGVSEENYMSGNLLSREVTAEDVAQAFVSLAKAESTTAATLTVDGGNIEASLR